jgi:IclR family acetate operon transcriptional repressor
MTAKRPNMDRYRIPNLARACQILKMFGSSWEKLSASEIARRFSMPRTTVLRIVQTLCSEGLLVREGANYSAGTELIRFGLQMFDPMRVRAVSAPILRTLAAATTETAHLALLYGDKSLIADVCDSPAPVSAVMRSGTLDDIHASATGKVFIAFSSSLYGDEYFSGIKLSARTPNTLTTRAALKEECSWILRKGYAVDNEEYHVGVRCLAAPVWDVSGTLAAAIGITAPVATFPTHRIAEVAKHVVKAARKLSQQLGAETLSTVGKPRSVPDR